MKKSNLQLISSILKRYFRQYRKTLTFVFLLLLFTSVVSLSIPYISKIYVDKALPSANVAMMIYILIVYLLMTLISKAIIYIRAYIMARLNTLVMMKMRKDIVSRIHRIPMQKFLEYSDEYLFNRTVNDTVFIMDSFISSAISILHDVMIILIGLVFVLSMNIYLSLMMIAMILINVMISQYWGKILAKYNEPMMENYTIHNSSIQQTIEQTFIVKIYNLYHSVNHKIVRTFRKYYELYSELCKKTFISRFITDSIQDIARILIMLVSGLFIVKGRFTLGGLFAFLAYFDLINAPAMQLVQEVVAFIKNMPVYTRINELLTFPTEYPIDKHEKLDFTQRAALSNATFYYDQANKILERQSIVFERGPIYLINGPSGSGKTTMAMILLGIVRLKEGAVVYDGKEMHEHNLESIRDQCAYLEQEPTIIQDTIFENIRIGNMRATADQVLEAAKKAYVDEFVMQLPDTYETKLGESGISLSTGQKQRIALARSILRAPKLLLMDEPVSNVDPESEQYIYQTITQLARKMIIIIISHKLETNKIADVIITLKDSRFFVS